MEHNPSTKRAAEKGKAPIADIIAVRKTCDAEGTGLSHFILMDKQVKR